VSSPAALQALLDGGFIQGEEFERRVAELARLDDAAALHAREPGTESATAFAHEAKQLWSHTRTHLRASIDQLRKVIIATASGIPGMAEETMRLYDYLAVLESNELEQAVDALASQSETGAADADAQMRVVCAWIHAYRDEIDTDFFKDVDENNGFVKVRVRALALESLDRIVRGVPGGLRARSELAVEEANVARRVAELRDTEN
jgi:hypothetical protein